jgi:plastocyanin
MQISQFFLKGLNKTLKLINGTNFSYAGPWTTVYTTGTVIDTWYVGDFMTADYTISVDQGSSSKEIVKCLVAGTTQNASVTVYGRTNLAGNLINLTATVNNSRVSLIARAITGDCKVIYSVNYYQTLSTPLPAVSSIIPIIPTYSVAPNINSAIESDTIVYTVTTTDVDDNTVLYWINSGTTSSADFDDAVDSGTVTIVSNVGTILRTLVNDLNTEGDETVVIEIRNGSTTGELLAISTPTVVSDTSVDPTTPQYAVAPSTLTATEGTTVTFTVTTTNVADGTTLYWSNEGTTNGATDFAYPGSNNGTFVITGGVGTVDITLVNDLTTEGPENIIFKVRTGSITGVVVATSFTVTVLDTSIALTQSYDAAPNLNSILEGNGVTYTITTSNVPDNTTLYWTNSGTTVSSDFNDFSNNGSFTIINNVGYVTRTLRNDLQTEGSETIILEIRTSSVVGPIVATAPDVTVIDSSTGSVIASYAISPSASFVNEGGTINYTVTTSNVADGTNLYWTNSGTTVDVDFTDNSNNGFVGINSGTGVISRTLKNDLLTEGTETVILQLRTNSIIGSVVAVASTVTVNDSSTG